MSILVFLLSLGAALRLTRLLVHDKITKPIRDRLMSLASREASLGQRASAFFSAMLGCPWCTGFWVSAVTAAAELRVDHGIAPGTTLWWTYPALTLGLSYLVGVFDMAVYTLEIYEPPTRGTEH